MTGVHEITAAALKVVRYRAEHHDSVLRLQTQLWSPELEVNRRYFKWKYQENPFNRDGSIYLALLGDVTIGMRGFMGGEWEIGNATPRIAIPCAGDAVVDVRHRGKGVLSRIMNIAEHDLLERGYQYVINFSSNHENYRRSLHMGWRPVISRQCLLRQATLVPATSPTRFEALGVSAAVLRDGVKNVSASTVSLPGEMACLVERIGDNGRIRHRRSTAYYAWRFTNPLRRYRFLYWRDNVLRGYIILGQWRNGDGPINILDWEGEDARIRGLLLRAAVDACGDSNLHIARGTLGREALQQLYEVGFRPAENGGKGMQDERSVIVKATDKTRPVERWRIGGRSLIDAASWDIRMIYSDGY